MVWKPLKRDEYIWMSRDQIVMFFSLVPNNFLNNFFFPQQTKRPECFKRIVWTISLTRDISKLFNFNYFFFFFLQIVRLWNCAWKNAWHAQHMRIVRSFFFFVSNKWISQGQYMFIFYFIAVHRRTWNLVLVPARVKLYPTFTSFRF